ncbi:N-terminal acetyltransferase A, auxiliary subunit [Aphelenchoides bicaudatus]|nr:N-terminal acetyltransferase A, auxiliary subunit [Aphelenchoides bicaudatus]
MMQLYLLALLLFACKVGANCNSNSSFTDVQVEAIQSQNDELNQENQQLRKQLNSYLNSSTGLLQLIKQDQINLQVEKMQTRVVILIGFERFEEAMEISLQAIGVEKAGSNRTQVVGDIWMKVAICYVKMGKFEHALRAANKALVIKPKNALNLCVRARIHRLMKNDALAINDLRSAISLDPNNEDARELMAGMKRTVKIIET